MLNTGEQGATRASYFYFNDQCLAHDGFHQLVQSKWIEFDSSFHLNAYSLDKWHGRLQKLRKFLKGWSLGIKGEQNASRKDLTSRIQALDHTAKNRLLTFQEWDERIALEKELDIILKLDDVYWKQKARTKWLLEGDANAHFYHQFANGRKRKNRIAFLDSDSGEVRGLTEITSHIVAYYKSLFGKSDTYYIQLGAEFWPKDLILSDINKEALVKSFDIQEIKEVIMDMKVNSAPGPNGFGVSFFKPSGSQLRGLFAPCFRISIRDIWTSKDLTLE